MIININNIITIIIITTTITITITITAVILIICIILITIRTILITILLLLLPLLFLISLVVVIHHHHPHHHHHHSHNHYHHYHRYRHPILIVMLHKTDFCHCLLAHMLPVQCIRKQWKGIKRLSIPHGTETDGLVLTQFGAAEVKLDDTVPEQEGIVIQGGPMVLWDRLQQYVQHLSRPWKVCLV